MDLGLKDRVAIGGRFQPGPGQSRRAGARPRGSKAGPVRAHRNRRCDAAAEEIRRETGAEVMTRALDVTVYEQVRRFVADAAERFGRLDICVANAGGPPSKCSRRPAWRNGMPPPN